MFGNLLVLVGIEGLLNTLFLSPILSEGPHYIDHFEFIASRMEPMTSRLKNIEEALRRFIETG